jgi:hypothetical protein
MVNEVQNRVVRVWAAVSGAMHERRLASDADSERSRLRACGSHVRTPQARINHDRKFG